MSFGSGFGAPSSFGASQSTGFGAQQPSGLGFSFAAQAPPNATPSLFGTQQQQPQQQQPAAGFSFGNAAPAPTVAAPTTNSGFPFGTPAAASTGGFGLQAAAPTGGFGSPAPATGGFGATATPAPAFGAATAGFGSPAPAFGASNNTSGFGSANTSFTAQPTTSAPAFGASFGTPAVATSGFGGTLGTGLGGATGGTGLSFGAPVTTTAAPSLGLSFGTAPAAATTAPGFSFGTATTAASGFGLGAPASTAAPTLGLSFGATPSTSLGLSFNTSTASSTAGLNFGLGSNTATTSAFTLGGFGTTPASTAAPVSTAPIGLGGIPSSTPSSTTFAAKTELAPKEQLLPNEIQQTVDNFKNFVKLQKSYSSDVARCSVKEFRKVESDIDSLNTVLNEVGKQLKINLNVAEKLKYDTAKSLQQVEMAQRTYDTPIGLQYENTAPLHYFLELADHFERDMQSMRLQIESTDKFIKDNGKTTPLTHQDLIVGMRRIHEIFVALAGNLQALHTQVDSQKEQYLNFRKYMLNDSTNVFENNSKDMEKSMNQIRSFSLKPPPMLASGPTPFGNVTHPSVVQAAAQSQPPSYQAATSGFGLGSSTLGSSGFGFGNNNPAPLLFGGGSSSFGFGLGSNTSGGFQLQKPPTGNKRGKQ